LPAITVDRGLGPLSPLACRPKDVTGFGFVDSWGERRDLEAFLTDQHVDALLVWHDGVPVLERYRNGQTHRTRHIVFSVTKPFTGLLTEMLIHEGLIDETARLERYDFHYVTANSEVLGWLLERVTGTPFAQLFEERLFQPIGPERDAFFLAGPHGKAVAGGGTPRPSLWGNEDGRDNSYRSQWYVHHPSRTYSAAGVHGQNLYVNPAAQVVVVIQSTYPQADGEFFGVNDAFFHGITAWLTGP
jgi:CubicO group peptidase (beta-lactamase class C family)